MPILVSFLFKYAKILVAVPIVLGITYGINDYVNKRKEIATLRENLSVLELTNASLNETLVRVQKDNKKMIAALNRVHKEKEALSKDLRSILEQSRKLQDGEIADSLNYVIDAINDRLHVSKSKGNNR